MKPGKWAENLHRITAVQARYWLHSTRSSPPWSMPPIVCRRAQLQRQTPAAFEMVVIPLRLGVYMGLPFSSLAWDSKHQGQRKWFDYSSPFLLIFQSALPWMVYCGTYICRVGCITGQKLPQSNYLTSHFVPFHEKTSHVRPIAQLVERRTLDIITGPSPDSSRFGARYIRASWRGWSAVGAAAAASWSQWVGRTVSGYVGTLNFRF